MSPAFSRPSNSPARSTLSYRIGTRTDFLRWMLDRLPRQQIPDGPHAGQRPLANLATHSPHDPTVALLDAFAVTSDVLTFYQERIVNEGFLRTAVERRSVMEMGRALGFELSPGLAASAWLAFSVEQATGAPPEVVIDPGVRVLSVPGQNQRPRTFETVERIVARPEWNQLKPLTSIPQDFTSDAAELWIDVGQASLSTGDALLFVSHDRETNAASSHWALRIVTEVVRYPASSRAKVRLVPTAGAQPPVPNGGCVYLMNQRAAVFGHSAPDWKGMPTSVQSAFGGMDNWDGFEVTLNSGRLLLDNLYPKLLPQTWMLLTAGSAVQLYWVKSIQTIGNAQFTLTARSTAPELVDMPASGHKAADLTAFTKARRGIVVLGQGSELPLVDRPLVNDTWGPNILAPFPNVEPNPPLNLFDRDDQVALDGVVLGLTAGRTLLVTGKRLRATVLTPRGVTLKADSGVTASYVQGSTLFVVTRPLPIPQPPPPAPRLPPQSRWRLSDALGFVGTVDIWDTDQALALAPAADADPVIAEVAVLKGVEQTPIRTTLRFTAPLKYWYDRATTSLCGNVTTATHGETVTEALGSGDGGQANQRFTLRRTPLTWISAANETGRQSTLEIRVDGVLWHHVSSFHDQSPSSRVYLAQRDEQGRTTVVFGDGVHGARLPSGLENVVAKYSVGLGLEGEVGQGKIMLFQTRPLGVNAVTNPLSATGGEAPDSGSTAKAEIPASVLTLDRVVSLTDYETFSEAFAGIGKAKATFLRKGEERSVHITLALADGSPAPHGAVVLAYLRAALDAVRDTTTRVEMAGYLRTWFRVSLKLTVAKDYLFANVVAAATAAMTEAFSFERRAFGQDVSAAEIVSLLQCVPGISAVDLDGLDSRPDLRDQSIPATPNALLEARDAHWDPTAPPDKPVIVPAELLLLDPSPIGLTFRNMAEPS